MTPPSLTHAELARALKTLHLGVGASDLHGSLTGFLCAGGKTDPDAWPLALEIEIDDASVSRYDVLRALYSECTAQLDDPDFRFEPLLPAGEATVEQRAEALVDWCRGFLGGVGLAGSPTLLLSDDANEVLADLGRIASSRFDYDDAEEDESALSEVLEFVRVGVLLLHTELVRPRAPARRSIH